MSVIASELAITELYPGLKDIARWRGSSYVIGDASGGNVTLGIIISKAMFPGNWLFTVDQWDMWTTATAATYYGSITIFGREPARAGYDMQWSRIWKMQSDGANGIASGDFCPEPPRWAWKPKESPTIQGFFPTNVNVQWYYLSASGHIYDSRAIGMTRRLF